MHAMIELFEKFRTYGDRPAIIYRSGVRRTSYSYREIHTLASTMVSFLADAGVKPGDRVLLWGPNHPAWVVAFWGIIARGAVAVPVDFMSGAERRRILAGSPALFLLSRADQSLSRSG